MLPPPNLHLDQLAAANPNHHLWLNNGIWFCHYTHYPTEHTKERVRVTLKTTDIVQARVSRDALLTRVNAEKKLAPLYSHRRRAREVHRGALAVG